MLEAAKKFDTDVIIDVEGDKIYTDVKLVDLVIKQFLNSKNELAVLETLIYKCKIYLLGAIKRDYNFEINLMEEKIHSYQKRHLEIKKTLT